MTQWDSGLREQSCPKKSISNVWLCRGASMKLLVMAWGRVWWLSPKVRKQERLPRQHAGSGLIHDKMQEGKGELTLNAGTGYPRDSSRNATTLRSYLLCTHRHFQGKRELSTCQYWKGLLSLLLLFFFFSSVLWLQYFGRIWFFKGFPTPGDSCVQNNLECQRHTPQGEPLKPQAWSWLLGFRSQLVCPGQVTQPPAMVSSSLTWGQRPLHPRLKELILVTCLE